MKLLFTFLLLTSSLYAQLPYQSVVEGRTAYYKGPSYSFNDSGEVFAVRIDSILNVVDGRQLFQYQQVNNNEVNCLGSSWIGSKIIVMNDGLNIFVVSQSFSLPYDTFILQTSAAIGSNNLFHRFNDSSYLEATCTGLSLEMVLSDFDSVKTYSLQLKNPDGTNASSPWNQKVIRLSKSKGLISFFNLLYFVPGYAPEENMLVGFTNPIEGYNPPKASSIFVFDIGDEFQTADTQPFWWGTWHDTYSRSFVMDKSISPDGDTLSYTMSNYKVTLSWSNFEYQGATESTDTGPLVYALDDFFPLDSLPFSVQHDATPSWTPSFSFNYGYNHVYRSAFCLRDVISVPAFYIGIDSTTGCLNDGLCSGVCTVYEFAPGLGIIKRYSADYPSDYGYSLVYYKKGNDSCGIPIDFQVWLGTNEIYSDTSVNVYPNPSSTSFFLQSDHAIMKVEIKDQLGVLMKTYVGSEINERPVQLDVHELSAGIYLLEIYNQNGITTKKVIIQ